MHKTLFFVLFLSVVSCKHFEVKKLDSEFILNEELKTFNWQDVDVYPTFLSCKTSETKLDKKNCFEATLSNHILNSIKINTVDISKKINDTVVLDFMVSKQGELSLKSMKTSNFIKKEIPNLDTLFVNSLNTLPKIYPAIKRDQPVTAVFQLPIIIFSK